MDRRKINVVLGTATIGAVIDPTAKFNDTESTQGLLNKFRHYGHTDIDTAAKYSLHAPGTCESILGRTDFVSWAVMDTKVDSGPGSHTAPRIRDSISTSLDALKVKRVHVMYLHNPDRTTPFEETCRAMNEAYNAGKFEKFGISNYLASEVEEMVSICNENGWIKPSVYQGCYNPVARMAEEQLFPTLRKHDIRFYAYSPAAGGTFSKTSSRLKEEV